MHSLVVDRAGLARKLAHRPKAFILYELLQNAWDEPCTHVEVTATLKPGRPTCAIMVRDDAPGGFSDLRSVYTLFRDSKKGADPTKRGRFELGDKLLVALAQRAEITSTTGKIIIEGDRRYHSNLKTERGTIFYGEFRMTREEFDELAQAAHLLSAPAHIPTTFNGALLETRARQHSFEAVLPTVYAGDDGELRPTQRKTRVDIYAVRAGETAHIFEMGIPVVPTEDGWHYDVQQRVPVNWERDNVPPAYLRSLRVAVFNALHEHLDDTKLTWVDDALSDPRCEAGAVQTVLRDRFGARAVVTDPSDPEGTKLAMSQGYTVVPGSAFSKEAWTNVRKTGLLLPAGQVTPSPKPYDPNGVPETLIAQQEWSADMHRIERFAVAIFEKLFDQALMVRIVNEPKVGWLANFTVGSPHLCLNYGLLGPDWFNRPKSDPAVLDLLLHEFVHYTVSDHLSSAMHERATELGAWLVNVALEYPELFREEK